MLKKVKLRVIFFCISVAAFFISEAYSDVAREGSAQSLLYDQIFIGEISHRDDIVSQAISRLKLFEPQNPKLLSAEIQLYIQQKKLAKAQEALNTLEKAAPNSGEYQRMKTLINLNMPSGAKKLFMVKSMALRGKPLEAKILLDKLYQGRPPTINLEIDYWTLVAKIPNERALALNKLMDIYNKYIGLIGIEAARGNQEPWLLFFKKNISGIMVDSGFEALDSEQLSGAKKQFDEALTLYPDNSDAMAGLGEAAYLNKQYSRAKQEFEKSLAIYPDGRRARYGLIKVYLQQSPQKAIAYIESLSPFKQKQYQNAKNRILSGIVQDKAAHYEKIGEWQKALLTYKEAKNIYPEDVWITYKIATLFAKVKRPNMGITEFRNITKESKNSSAFYYAYALFLIDIENLTQANALLTNMPAKLKNKKIIELKLRIKILKLQSIAEKYALSKQWAKAISTYREIYQLSPDDVWSAYNLAVALNEQGLTNQSISIFEQLKHTLPNSPSQAYVYALFLAKIDRDESAVKHLNTIPISKWDEQMHELDVRLKENIIIAKGEALRKNGAPKNAYQLLLSHKPTKRLLLTLGNWSVADDDFNNAIQYYNQVLGLYPGDISAKIGVVNAYIGLDQKKEAKYLLSKLDNNLKNQSFDDQLKIANAWKELDELKKADAIFAYLRKNAYKAPTGDDRAIIFRDAARIATRLIHPQQARLDYEQAMLNAGMTEVLPKHDEHYSLLTRNHCDDDWLKKSIRADAAELFKQQAHEVTVEEDMWQLKGTPGISDYRADDSVFHYKSPYHDGVFYLRGDLLRLSAGTFETQNGVHFESFGTCTADGCTQDFKQTSSGFGIISGWENDKWFIMAGLTPIGFNIVNPIGSIGYSGDYRHITWTISALHTPLSNSLLSFSGARDPNTGIIWGGVTSTGLNLALSYDRGGAHGVWFNGLIGTIRGENVVNNNRIELMGGYYYKLINAENCRLSVGLSSLYWHYEKDLNGYTLGNGGYFSPQRFVTLSTPISYMRRTEDWSYLLRVSGSINNSQTKGFELYPIHSITPASALESNFVSGENSDSTFGYYFLGGVERRLNSHWRLGAAFDFQRSPGFAPNHFLLYIRYGLEPWQGDLDLPIRPIPPLTDFR